VITVVLVIAVAIVALFGYAASKPNSFRVQRSASIAAPPEMIFPLLEDLRRHLEWSPFEKDPAIQRKLSGAETGKGSVYEWSGNKQVGAGRIEITEAAPNSHVAMKLDMYKPFQARNVVEFTLSPNGGGSTDVTWAMIGPQPFMAKFMSMFMDCDKMVGGEFETGLAKLKALAERT
jgi:uncharacterized protein YndB with AHSA1/START domain